MMHAHSLWILHFFSTSFMTGLIWLIQIVHYPLMSYSLGKKFSEFHTAHSNRITWIVLPIMSTQVVTGFLLWQSQLPNLPSWQGILPFVFSLSTFVITGALFVPLHHKLNETPSFKMIHRLVTLNWTRTLIWTVHSLFLILTFEQWL